MIRIPASPVEFSRNLTGNYRHRATNPLKTTVAAAPADGKQPLVAAEGEIPCFPFTASKPTPANPYHGHASLDLIPAGRLCSLQVHLHRFSPRAALFQNSTTTQHMQPSRRHFSLFPSLENIRSLSEKFRSNNRTIKTHRLS